MRVSSTPNYWRIALAAVLGILIVAVAPWDTAHAAHGPFTTSTGIYRIPYADGTTVSANNDHHNHPNALNRVDLGGGDGATLVAAASGIIRGLVDNHGNDFGLGDGVGINGGAQDDTLENNCSGDGNAALVEGGSCGAYNNYVWIEHPNGEWTKYSHPKTGSVTALGWAIGDTILVGQALGLQGDVGAASGSHLHLEVAVPTDPTDTMPFSQNGGFVPNAWNVVSTVCFSDGDDNGDSLYTDGEVYTAGPCTNTAPTADAGGPYSVDEGSTVQLDGTGSSDPENAILSFSWSPDTNLDDGTIATPTYSAVDDTVDVITLTVSDLGGDVTVATELTDSDDATVTVNNVAPFVTAVGDTINEAGTATVTATFSDPGLLDTHAATIDWGDGNGPQAVSVAQGVGGGTIDEDHVYGDNGIYSVTVTVTDDDGGVDSDTVSVTVNNVDPVLSLDSGDAVSLPGGDYFVVEAGGTIDGEAEATDAGSDDLIFSWTGGDVNTYFNNGVSADPAMSPDGTFPFFASDMSGIAFADPGVSSVDVTVDDDDGGSDSASFGAIITGNAETTESIGWWKHQFNGNGNQEIDDATLQAYLDIVNAASSVFSETTALSSFEDAAAVLAVTGSDPAERATTDLLTAWLHFASGAVALDAEVPLQGNEIILFLDAMFQVEAVINNPASTKMELQEAEDLARRVVQAS